MADEPSRNGSAKPTDPTKPRIEPDQPTPNRDKRRQPVTIDLAPDPPKSAQDGTPAKPDAPKPQAAAGGVAPVAAKPAEPSAGVAKGEPPKTEAAKTEAPKSVVGSPTPNPPPPPATGAGSSSPKGQPPKPEPPKAAAAAVAPPAAAKPTTPPPGTTKPAVAAPVPPPRGGVAIALLASVACAAIVALGVAYGYQAYTGQGEVIAALKAQVAALQGRLDGVAKQVAAAPQTAALTTLEGGVDKKLSALEGGFDKRLAAADAARVQAADAAEQRLRKLEAIRNEVTASLEKRVGSLEALTTTLGAQIDQANTKAEVVRIQAARAIEAVAKASASPPGAPIVLPPTIDVAPIKARLEEVEVKLKAVEATLAKPKSEARATEVRAVAPPKADPATVAIVAQALATAFDSGAPYTGELATLEAIGAGDKAAPLKPFAAHGAPKFSELAAEFAALRPAILAAAAPPSSGGFLDRLSNGASGLISVRPTGEAAAHGTSPVALVAQIDAALGQADAAAALAAWDKLPPPSQKVSQAWADKLKAREAARQAALALASGSIAALAKPKS